MSTTTNYTALATFSTTTALTVIENIESKKGGKRMIRIKGQLRLYIYIHLFKVGESVQHLYS